jgi:endoglucanase
MKKIRNRTRVVRNSAIAATALIVATQTSGALLPNVVNAVNRLANVKLFVNSDSPAARQANEWRRSRPNDAALMDRIAAQPVAQWIGNWNRDVRGDVAGIVSRAAQQGATPVLVAYNITNRDCGSYSAGGSSSGSAYKKWIRDFAAGLSGKSAVVVLEPDAVPGADCLSASVRDERFALLRDAIQVLKNAKAVVYLDAGHARWLSPDDIASRLTAAGIAQADGFSLNVSNYHSTDVNVAYGDQVSKRVGGKHYIIDTSRNGVGGRGAEWCNVQGQALGNPPTTRTGHALADAFLWIKTPGESDGTCSGGPQAGKWWPEYALGLAQRAGISSVASR